MSDDGWICDAAQLRNVLAVMGADRNAEGGFVVTGQVASFMGAGEEFVIGSDAQYYVNGQARSLVSALALTSYGSAVVVI